MAIFFYSDRSLFSGFEGHWPSSIVLKQIELGQERITRLVQHSSAPVVRGCAGCEAPQNVVIFDILMSSCQELLETRAPNLATDWAA